MISRSPSNTLLCCLPSLLACAHYSQKQRSPRFAHNAQRRGGLLLRRESRRRVDGRQIATAEPRGIRTQQLRVALWKKDSLTSVPSWNGEIGGACPSHDRLRR